MHEQEERSAEPPFPGDRAEGRKTTTTLIILVVIVAISATFIIQNSDKATIRFLFISVTTRIWAGFLIALGLGAVVAWLFSMWWRRRQQA
jgi:uncharacterized integral membrane protein